jgi:hypothetical protein
LTAAEEWLKFFLKKDVSCIKRLKISECWLGKRYTFGKNYFFIYLFKLHCSKSGIK